VVNVDGARVAYRWRGAAHSYSARKRYCRPGCALGPGIAEFRNDRTGDSLGLLRIGDTTDDGSGLSLQKSRGKVREVARYGRSGPVD